MNNLLSVVIPSRNEYLSQYRERNREKIREYQKKWKLKNREKVISYSRKAYRLDIDKSRERSRKYYAENRQKELDRIRLKKYGITGELFRELLKKQNNKCPICQKKLTQNPSVDHDHNTGEVRGLICSPCNIAIGNAYDSPKILRAMADYLEKHNG